MAPGTCAAAAAPGVLSAVSLYHKSGRRAAAIVQKETLFDHLIGERQ
jgi:hypothetical protein